MNQARQLEIFVSYNTIVENHRIFLEYPLIYSLPFLYNIFPSFLYLIYSFLCLHDVYK